MTWNIPNQITIARMFLSAGFFVLLGFYCPRCAAVSTLMWAAFVLFIIAALTDVLDGYLARRWNQVTAFGRIVDPFVDKLPVVGAFIMLAGSNFAGTLNDFEANLPYWITGNMRTSVQSWMVVVILAREFIVSAIRGYSESQGIQYPAIAVGKIKMLLQSVALSSILFALANQSPAPWISVVKLTTVWAALLITVYSGVVYVHNAKGLLRLATTPSQETNDV